MTPARPNRTPPQRAQPPQVLAATPAGRCLLFDLNAGEGVPRHQHPQAGVVIAVLSGRLRVTTDEETRALEAAGVLTHGGDRPISLEATQPGTRVLVTLLNGALNGP